MLRILLRSGATIASNTTCFGRCGPQATSSSAAHRDVSSASQRRWLSMCGPDQPAVPLRQPLHSPQASQDAVDFDPFQPAPEEDAPLFTHTLTWRSGMEWIDISGCGDVFDSKHHRKDGTAESVQPSDAEDLAGNASSQSSRLQLRELIRCLMYGKRRATHYTARERTVARHKSAMAFRAALTPVLLQLGVSQVAIDRSAEPGSLPRVLSVEIRRVAASDSKGPLVPTATVQPGVPPSRSHHKKKPAPAAEGSKTTTRDYLAVADMSHPPPYDPTREETIPPLEDPAHPSRHTHRHHSPDAGQQQATRSGTQLSDDLYVDAGDERHGTDGPSCPVSFGDRPRPPLKKATCQPNPQLRGDGKGPQDEDEDEVIERTAVTVMFRFSPEDPEVGAEAANRRLDARHGDANVLILGMSELAKRISRESTPQDAIEDITKRITVFILPNRLITVHQADAPFIKKLREDWDGWYRKSGPVHLLNAIVRNCTDSFKRASKAESILLERLEPRLFKSSWKEYDESLQLLYAVSRRASMHVRVLRAMEPAHHGMCAAIGVACENAFMRELESSINVATVMSEEVRDSTQGLLSLHFQRAASELEGMMRMLTVFSAIFIPLEFVTACYGMNVDWLPWLKDDMGYVRVAQLMLVLTCITIGWFRARRFV